MVLEGSERDNLVGSHGLRERHGTFDDMVEEELGIHQIHSRVHSHSLDERFLSFLELIVLNSFVGAYGLVQVSMFMLVLPKECALLFPGNEAVGLAGMLGLAGATQLVCPVAGLFSDRTASPFGRRRPFIVLGTMVALLALSILWYLSINSSLTDPDQKPGFGYDPVSMKKTGESSLRDSRNLYIIAFIVLNLSLNICFAAYAGLIPDFVSPGQLGEASGIMAVMTALGSLIGVWLIGFMGMEPFTLYAGWLSACCLCTLFVVKETPLSETPEPIDFGAIFGVYFEPLQEDDNFFWVWVSRLLYYMGISVQVFMQYFIRDVIGVAPQDAKTQTALVSITMLAASSVVAVPCGMLSDEIGRKPLVYISCGLMAIVYLGWTFATEMWHILLWSVVFGFANGTYLSVDYALGCDVIPDKEKHAAQALGVWGVAAFLGSTLGPVISGPVLYFVGVTNKPDVYSHQGYAALLFIGAVFVLGSSIALKNLVEVGSRTRDDEK